MSTQGNIPEVVLVMVHEQRDEATFGSPATGIGIGILACQGHVNAYTCLPGRSTHDVVVSTHGILFVQEETLIDYWVGVLRGRERVQATAELLVRRLLPARGRPLWIPAETITSAAVTERSAEFATVGGTYAFDGISAEASWPPGANAALAVGELLGNRARQCASAGLQGAWRRGYWGSFRA